MQAPPPTASPDPASAGTGHDDYFGLPAAIEASKAGAINNKLVHTTSADAVLKLTVQHASHLNSVNAATALHRLAQHLKKARSQRDRLLRDARFEELLQTTAERMAHCSPRSVSDVLWAFATLQHWPPEMLKPVLTQVATHLESHAFEAQHLALIAWAFAVLGLKPVRLLEQIELNAVAQLRSFNHQNCANLLWGFAKLNYKPEARRHPPAVPPASRQPAAPPATVCVVLRAACAARPTPCPARSPPLHRRHLFSLSFPTEVCMCARRSSCPRCALGCAKTASSPA